MISVLLILACAASNPAAATSETTVTVPAGSLSLPATLLRPDGAGPFPAIVIVHDCSGLGSRSSGAPLRWGRELAAQGYVILIPDSFGPRGYPNGVCTVRPGEGGAPATPSVRTGDAFAALAMLRALPFVIGARVGLMGGSHGGSTTLATIAIERRDGFAAAIALYPSCTRPTAQQGGVYRPASPLLILTGELDDWTPAEPCRVLTQNSWAAGHPVDIKIYPGAHHSFDSAAPVRYVAERTNANAPSGRGATTDGNLAAWRGCAAAGVRLLRPKPQG